LRHRHDARRRLRRGLDLARGRGAGEAVGGRRVLRVGRVRRAAGSRRRARQARRRRVPAGGRRLGRGAAARDGGGRCVGAGGGWAGATAAKYVRMEDPSLEVVLIEPNRKFISCPFSNLVLSGVRSIGSLTFGYSGLREQHGVKILHESATAIEPDTRRVRLDRGFLNYERLIVAPGIDFQTEQIEGLA